MEVHAQEKVHKEQLSNSIDDEDDFADHVQGYQIVPLATSTARAARFSKDVFDAHCASS